MLSMLDVGRKGNYRVPYTILNDPNPYTLGAYMAAMRFATRFNEVQGSIRNYVEYFGCKMTFNPGGTRDMMAKGLARLAEMDVFNATKKEVLDLNPSNHFYYKFNRNWGWTFHEYPLSVMYPVVEIDAGVQRAKRAHWGNVDSLIDVIRLVGHLRSFMETTQDSINPTQRWQEAVAIVDYQTCQHLLDTTKGKLNKRLKRMKDAGFGNYRKIQLRGGGLRATKTLIIFVNKSDSKKEQQAMNRAKKNLLNFYKGSYISKVVNDSVVPKEEVSQEQEEVTETEE